MSICDLVADLRAPTPSAAAEAAVPVQSEMRERLRGTAAVLSGLTADHVARARTVAAEAARQIAGGAARRVDRRRLELQSAASALNALSPLATLERGYAIVRSVGGKTVRSVRALEPGSAVDLVFRDGVATATVDRVAPNDAGAPVAGSALESQP
jgi:exodeoxyribonuclease VII large subunit